MKCKIIKLISVILIAAFAWQNVVFADGRNLRPLAFAQRQDAELRVVDISDLEDINGALEQITQINFQVDSLFDLFNAEICRTVRNSYQRDPNNLFLNPRLRTFLIMAGDTIVGYAVYNYSGKNSNVEYLAVRPLFQGRGAGSALMKQVFDFTLENRKNTVTVYTHSKNDTGRLFYRKIGRTMARHYTEAFSREVVPGGEIENVKFSFWLTSRAAFAQMASEFFKGNKAALETRLLQDASRAAASSILRPLARAEKFRDTMGYNSSPKGLPGVWFDNEEVYIQNGHMICYFDDGRAFLKNEFPEVANLITNPLELHKFLQGLYANRTEDMARFDYARSHDVFERPDDTPLAYARRKGLLKNMLGCQWISNTQSFRRHIATNGRRHISLKIPGEKTHGMQLVDEGNYVVSGTVWNAYRGSAHIAKPICEIVFPPGVYKNYTWEPDVKYDNENPYRVVIYRYVDGIRLNTLTPSHIKYFAEQLHCSEEHVIEIILKQVFEIAEKIHDLGFAMMQLYLPLDDADRIDRSRMQDASLLSDLHAGNFIVSLEGNEIVIYHVSDFESTNTIEPEAIQLFLTDPSYRLDQLHVFLGGFTEDGQFIESNDIQIGDLIIPAAAARAIAQEIIDEHIKKCNVTRARLVIAQLNNVELTDEPPPQAQNTGAKKPGTFPKGTSSRDMEACI